MDKRIFKLNEVYIAHCKLIDACHNSIFDNKILWKFCQSFVDFVNTLNVTLSRKRFDYIFNLKLNLHNKPQLNAHLHAAKEYAENIVEKISERSDIDLFKEFIGIAFDLPKLLTAVEKVYEIKFGNFAGNRNTKINSYTAYKVANQLFWPQYKLEKSNTLNGYAIFAIRQAIELAGKELIGLENILEKDGKTFKYGSQIPWEFITLNKEKPYFKFIFNAHEIQKIFKWSNYFVHTGNDTACYITALALSTIKDLYQQKIYINIHGYEDFYYANEINNYQTLKNDFEEFLSKYNKPKFAKWGHQSLANVTG